MSQTQTWACKYQNNFPIPITSDICNSKIIQEKHKTYITFLFRMTKCLG